MNRRAFIGALAALVAAPAAALRTKFAAPPIGTWADIERSTYAFWRAQSATPLNGVAYENMRAALRSPYLRGAWLVS